MCADKRAIAQNFETRSTAETRAAVRRLVIKAGISPGHDTVRFSRGLMARRAIITTIILMLIMMQSVIPTADAPVIRHPGDKPGIWS